MLEIKPCVSLDSGTSFDVREYDERPTCERYVANFIDRADAELFVRAKESAVLSLCNSALKRTFDGMISPVTPNDCGQTTPPAGRELLAADPGPVYDFGNTAEVREFDHLYGDDPKPDVVIEGK